MSIAWEEKRNHPYILLPGKDIRPIGGLWELPCSRHLPLNSLTNLLTLPIQCWEIFDPRADVNLGEPAPPPALDATSC